ncbi:MAG TPA: PQQ-binding-like beta-propeller repeat protein [Sumerlaeia bacterium]|nr:PQQ-binding-like beta-propeller repeat protein [Sumerlaeia bacterium]
MMRTKLIAIGFLVVLCRPCLAKDWPQFRADAARSGYTGETVPASLSPQWVYRPLHSPRPAWVGEDTRMPFDYAPHVAVSGGTVLFGSTVDCKVRALDAATGKERWTFFTDGPIRFAPAVWKDRAFVASDDGYLYCLDVKTGSLLWKKRGGPRDDMLLGNGRMISRWPARGAPTVAGDALYFCAGIWPSEGIHIYALHPRTGEVLWLNDSAGGMEMDQPHGGARAKSGVSAQGYLTAAGDALLVPTGRAVPAAFDLSDGKFRYFHLQSQSGRGHGAVALADELTYAGSDVFRTSDGRCLTRRFSSLAMAVLPEHIVFAEESEIRAVRRSGLLSDQEVVDRKGNKTRERLLNESVWRDPEWAIPCAEPVGVSLIAAGQTVFVGTGKERVLAADLESKRVVKALEVEGLPLGLAAADGRLFVSTDQGRVYCFGAEGAPGAWETGPKRKPSAYGRKSLYADAAREIVAATGVREGYCLDLGCGDGALACELAKATNLHIVAVEPDPKAAAAARERLDAAGLYGSRVTVFARDLSDTRLPNYFADLVVSGSSIERGSEGLPRDEMRRLQRPYGGVICVGKPGKMTPAVRGPLEGAGVWTHQYAGPANPGCSTDVLVKAPLGMLWFDDNDYEMPSRHGRGPAPLFSEGRLFVQALHGIRAINAYNGRVLWEYPLPNALRSYDQEHLNGVAATGSGFCMADNSVYVRTGNRCLRLDAATGRKLGEFPAPLRPDGKAGTWGFLACENGALYGSLSNEEHIIRWAFGQSDMSRQYAESLLLFAMDAKTGEVKWTFTPKRSIRHNAIAMGGGRVCLIDRPLASQDRISPEKAEHSLGELIALDAETGGEIWRVSENVYGTLLALSVKHGILLMSYQSTRFALPSEKGGQMAGFRLADGERVWDVEAQYESRPLINDRTIFAQPGAWDLLTGERREDFNLTRSYGCGILAGSTHLLAYRSATLGYWDLIANTGTHNYGGIRPGCWINAIPAGGLLLMPEASNRCVCSYLIKATVALQTMH